MDRKNKKAVHITTMITAALLLLAILGVLIHFTAIPLVQMQ
jgi:hypothetical protein